MLITNRKHLLAVLGLNEKQLEELLGEIPKLYNPYIKKEVKSDGKIKERAICPSVGKLLTIQHRIKKRILDLHALPEYVQGGVKGKDSISNSKRHQGLNHHFCLDLKNFFPSVKNNRVNKVLLRLGYSPDVASIITKLVTFKNQVPQGAPTSTSITNLVFYSEVDVKLEKLLEGRNIVYTRYVDDLNFSSQGNFDSLTTEITSIISDSNFKINRTKTFYKIGKVPITGSIVGQNRISPTQKLKDKLLDPDRSESSKLGVQNFINRIEKTN
jgi:RNA-directed DNA polymerase